MKIKFTNNAASTIKNAIVASSTSLVVASGTGALFPTLSSGEYFYATLVGQDKMEIVKVTARSGDTFTIVRGQDGTTAQAFSAGDVIELRITAAAFNEVAEAISEAQSSADASVKKTGNEVIAGVKTLTNYMQIQNTAVGAETWVSQVNNRYFEYIDKNGVVLSAIQFRMTATENAIRFLARPPKDATSTFSGHTILAAENKADGTKRAYCVEPAADSNTNDIATTAWVRARNTISTAAPSGGTPGDTWIQYIA